MNQVPGPGAGAGAPPPTEGAPSTSKKRLTPEEQAVERVREMTLQRRRDASPLGAHTIEPAPSSTPHIEPFHRKSPEALFLKDAILDTLDPDAQQEIFVLLYQNTMDYTRLEALLRRALDHVNLDTASDTALALIRDFKFHEHMAPSRASTLFTQHLQALQTRALDHETRLLRELGFHDIPPIGNREHFDDYLRRLQAFCQNEMSNRPATDLELMEHLLSPERRERTKAPVTSFTKSLFPLAQEALRNCQTNLTVWAHLLHTLPPEAQNIFGRLNPRTLSEFARALPEVKQTLLHLPLDERIRIGHSLQHELQLLRDQRLQSPLIQDLDLFLLPLECPTRPTTGIMREFDTLSADEMPALDRRFSSVHLFPLSLENFESRFNLARPSVYAVGKREISSGENMQNFMLHLYAENREALITGARRIPAEGVGVRALWKILNEIHTANGGADLQLDSAQATPVQRVQKFWEDIANMLPDDLQNNFLYSCPETTRALEQAQRAGFPELQRLFEQLPEDLRTRIYSYSSNVTGIENSDPRRELQRCIAQLHTRQHIVDLGIPVPNINLQIATANYRQQLLQFCNSLTGTTVPQGALDQAKAYLTPPPPPRR